MFSCTQCQGNVQFAGLYAENLRPWLEHFVLGENLHIVDGDNFIRRPWEELEAVQDFLGVPRDPPRDNFVLWDDVNEGRFYCLQVTGGLAHVVCMGQDKGRAQRHVPPEVVARLDDFFAPHNEELFRLIGRRFDWPRHTNISAIKWA